MKKINLHKSLAWLLMGLMLITLTACGGSGNNAAPETSEATVEKIVLKYGDGVSTGDPQYISSEFFAEQLTDMTNGQVEVQLYPNSQLGTQREMTEGLKLNTIEIVKTTNAVMTGFVPETKVLDLPYLFRDTEHARAVLDGEVGDQLKAAAEDAGYKILWFFTPRARSVYNSSRPIYAPSDMNGLTIRVIESPIMIDTINTMGGLAVPLPFGEVYSALEQGVVDGAENSVISYQNMKHSEVAPFFSETQQFFSPELVVMSLDKFNSLPENVQQAIESLALEVVAYEHEVYMQQETEARQQLAADGIQFNEVDLDAFREAMLPLYEKHANDVGGMDLIQRIINY